MENIVKTTVCYRVDGPIIIIHWQKEGNLKSGNM